MDTDEERVAALVASQDAITRRLNGYLTEINQIVEAIGDLMRTNKRAFDVAIAAGDVAGLRRINDRIVEGLEGRRSRVDRLVSWWETDIAELSAASDRTFDALEAYSARSDVRAYLTILDTLSGNARIAFEQLDGLARSFDVLARSNDVFLEPATRLAAAFERMSAAADPIQRMGARARGLLG